MVLGQKNQLSEETEVLHSMINQLDSELRCRSKPQLIDEASNLIKAAHRVCRQPMPSLVTGTVPADFLRFVYICVSTDWSGYITAV